MDTQRFVAVCSIFRSPSPRNPWLYHLLYSHYNAPRISLYALRPCLPYGTSRIPRAPVRPISRAALLLLFPPSYCILPESDIHCFRQRKWRSPGHPHSDCGISPLSGSRRHPAIQD